MHTQFAQVKLNARTHAGMYVGELVRGGGSACACTGAHSNSYVSLQEAGGAYFVMVGLAFTPHTYRNERINARRCMNMHTNAHTRT